MKEKTLSLKGTNLYDLLSSVEYLREAWKAVKAKKGAPGVDGVTVEDFEKNESEELKKLSDELREWRYEPQPVRKVEIPKPGGAGKRSLGIPTVRDRIVHQSVKMVLEAEFEEGFSQSSFGFRPNRGQREAISEARGYVESGKEWVVDIDLEKFFDCINHDRLLYLLRREVKDKAVIKLIAIILKSGILFKGEYEATQKGVPQGSPLSPLLSNIVLDELDKELEKRGLSFCRYADDCQIYVGSRKAGNRIMKSLTRFIERRLKLKVNVTKSCVRKVGKGHFLGFRITPGNLKLSAKTRERLKSKIRDLTPRRTHVTLSTQIKRINRWLRGWAIYFLPALNRRKLISIEGHIRRRLRSQIVRNQKRRRYLYNKFIRQGVSVKPAKKAAYNNRGVWKTSQSQAAHRAWSNAWFRRQGLIEVSQKYFPITPTYVIAHT